MRQAVTDYIYNGMANGDVGQVLADNGFDVNALRPWIGEDGRTYIAKPRMRLEIISNQYFNVPVIDPETKKPVYDSIPVANVTGTLRKNEWQLLDEAIEGVSKERLMLQADLRSRGLVFTIPNGMGTTVLQTETVSDTNEATIDMDGLTDAENDRPEYEITNLPLPIIHAEFSFSRRQIATSRTLGASIDTTAAELKTRRVWEGVEKLLLGIAQTHIAASFTYGGGTVYGYSNFPSRLTKTITSPTSSGWTAATLITELLAAREQLTAQNFFGPYMIYVGAGWDQYLDDDHKANSEKTLRQRILQIEGFQGIKRADYLTGYTLFLIQMTRDVIRTIIGMDITTVQWPSKGGLKQNFKIMTIQVPQLRADQTGQTGILHATV